MTDHISKDRRRLHDFIRSTDAFIELGIRPFVFVFVKVLGQWSTSLDCLVKKSTLRSATQRSKQTINRTRSPHKNHSLSSVMEVSIKYSANFSSNFSFFSSFSSNAMLSACNFATFFKQHFMCAVLNRLRYSR